MSMNRYQQRADAISGFRLMVALPEDIDHVQVVGMGRKRYGEFDDSDLRG